MRVGDVLVRNRGGDEEGEVVGMKSTEGWIRGKKKRKKNGGHAENYLLLNKFSNDDDEKGIYSFFFLMECNFFLSPFGRNE